MPPPAPAEANDFATAIARLKWSALKLFNAGFDAANTPPAAPDPSWSEERKKEFARQQAERVSKGEGQMAKAVAQLADLDKQLADAAGVTDVAALMHTTATMSVTVCDRITALTGPASVAEIDSLARVLAALAALSPAANWQESAPAANTQ